MKTYTGHAIGEINSPLTYAEPAKTLNPFFVVWGIGVG